jgi:cysteine desulfurase / selenocysteine lyase
MQTGGAVSFGSEDGNFASSLPSEELQSAAVWDWWRSQMPIHRQWAYLDHAAVAPLSQPAGDAIRSWASQAETLGDTVWPHWAANIARMRGQFAELIHADADDLFVVPNTSTGISLVAEGFPWKSGENVVVPEGEFPSNLFPWLNQKHRGVDVRIVPRRGMIVDIDEVMAHVNDRTRMIAASWVGYASGYRIDLAELVRRAHERGVLVFLDAIQGLGVHPLDLKTVPVDFLAADGHKWLLGPEGVGIAMIRREHRSVMRCPIVGWNSVRNAHHFSHSSFELREEAARYEPGSANMVGIAGLSASVEIFLRVIRACGRSAIENRVLELSGHLAQELVRVGASVERSPNRANQSGIVTFTFPGLEPAVIRERALANQIVLSCRGGGVRASVHAYNNSEDIERLITTLGELRSASSRTP